MKFQANEYTVEIYGNEFTGFGYEILDTKELVEHDDNAFNSQLEAQQAALEWISKQTYLKEEYDAYLHANGFVKYFRGSDTNDCKVLLEAPDFNEWMAMHAA